VRRSGKEGGEREEGEEEELELEELALFGSELETSCPSRSSERASLTGRFRHPPSTVTKSRSTRRTLASVVEPSMPGSEELWARKASRAKEEEDKEEDEEVEGVPSFSTTAAEDDDDRRKEEALPPATAAARDPALFNAASRPAVPRRLAAERSRRAEAGRVIFLWLAN